MQAKGLGTCARQLELVKEVATNKSVDVILPVLRGGVHGVAPAGRRRARAGHRPYGGLRSGAGGEAEKS